MPRRLVQIFTWKYLKRVLKYCFHKIFHFMYIYLKMYLFIDIYIFSYRIFFYYISIMFIIKPTVYIFTRLWIKYSFYYLCTFLDFVYVNFFNSKITFGEKMITYWCNCTLSVLNHHDCLNQVSKQSSHICLYRPCNVRKLYYSTPGK